MKKSILFAACSLAFVATSALAQVGLGLGAGVGGGLSAGAGASNIATRTDLSGKAGLDTPALSASASGSARASADVHTPNVVDTAKDRVQETKKQAKDKIHDVQDKRDRLEERTDKQIDKL